MGSQAEDQDLSRSSAAKYSLKYFENKMRVGLGTGSTAEALVQEIAARNLQKELDLTFVSTSTRTTKLAESLGLRISELSVVKHLDLVLDGTDEFDSGLSLIKGGGGALLQEKIVASSADSMKVIASISKKVDVLGKFPLPIEIIRFGWASTLERLDNLFVSSGITFNSKSMRTEDNKFFVTDEGHFIVDYSFEQIPDPSALEQLINQIVGVVECGLFVGLCDQVITGTRDGIIEVFDCDG